MPCTHCAHCKAAQDEIEAVLAIKMSQSSFDDFPITTAQEVVTIPEEEIPPLNDYQQPIALEICNTFKDQKLHFIEGITQTGKTYMLNAMYGLFKNMNINVEVISTCSFPRKCKTIIKMLSTPDEVLESIDVFLIDNANQISQDLMKSLCEKLKRSMGSDQPFGGKSIVLAADFGQLLPFSTNFNQKAKTSLKHLTENMVAPFKKHTLPVPADNWSQFLNSVRSSSKIAIMDSNIVKSLDTLIDFTFGPLYNEIPHLNAIILTPKKADVDFLNREILNKINEKELVFEAQFNAKIIRSDLDLHQLRLKKNCLLILEETFEELPKGTRLLFQEATRTHLCCTVLETGQQVDVDRVKRYISPNSSTSRKSGSWKDDQQCVKQFPVSLSFASTIHSAQGKRFERLGLFNLDQSFEHGMVYTAMSRVTRSEDYRIFTKDTVIENKLDKTLI